MFYHCTDKESADAILESGYKAPIKPHWVYDFTAVFFAMLPEEHKKKILPKFKDLSLESSYAERSAFYDAVRTSKTAVKKIESIWFSLFGGGVIVWATRERPWTDEYGEVALWFTPPPNAVEMMPGSERTMFYVPGPVVAPRHFVIVGAMEAK